MMSSRRHRGVSFFRQSIGLSICWEVMKDYEIWGRCVSHLGRFLSAMQLIFCQLKLRCVRSFEDN